MTSSSVSQADICGWLRCPSMEMLNMAVQQITLSDLLSAIAGADSLYGGEAITQNGGVLQCALLAEQANEPSCLIAACLLHDVGHLLHTLGDDCADQGVNDAHEIRAESALRDLFPASVVAPIAMHVDAKRYLCAVDDGYIATLSPASVTSPTSRWGVFNCRGR